jgi:hypothetical protein
LEESYHRATHPHYTHTRTLTHIHTHTNWKVGKWGSSSNYLVKEKPLQKPFWKEPSEKKQIHFNFLSLKYRFSMQLFTHHILLHSASHFFLQISLNAQFPGWMMADTLDTATITWIMKAIGQGWANLLSPWATLETTKVSEGQYIYF